jgi:hypothetical protein
MPQIDLTDSCYDALVARKNKIVKEKENRGIKEKTTFSEVVCSLLKETKGGT